MGAWAERNTEMNGWQPLIAGLATAVVVSFPVASFAERITEFAPFFYDTDTENVLFLEGDIDSRTDFRLGRALHRFPEIETLVLSSQGGTVYDGLSMATTIREYGLKTFIPPEGECYSACAYLFFAGIERKSDGELGVHQLDGLGGDFTFGQEILSEVFDSLHSYGVPGEVIVKMLRTPPDKMFVYQPNQLAAMNLLGPVGAEPQSVPQGSVGVVTGLLASDPAAFVRFLEKHGRSPELTTDQLGDPMIIFQDEGEAEHLLFYDCTDNADCLAVQLYAGYQMDDDVPLDVLNTWNGGLTRRFTRAFVGDDKTVNIEMDIATSRDGMSERDFYDLLGLWLIRKGEFEERIGF